MWQKIRKIKWFQMTINQNNLIHIYKDQCDLLSLLRKMNLKIENV